MHIKRNFVENYYEVAHNCLFAKTRTVSRYVTNFYAKALKDVGVTPVQYSMLTAIQILKQGNINDLSSALKMDRTTINRNLKPLVRDGYVYIHESDDKRERRITITKKGEEIYNTGYKAWEKVQEELKCTLGEENWDDLNAVLGKVIKVIAQD